MIIGLDLAIILAIPNLRIMDSRYKHIINQVLRIINYKPSTKNNKNCSFASTVAKHYLLNHFYHVSMLHSIQCYVPSIVCAYLYVSACMCVYVCMRTDQDTYPCTYPLHAPI